MQINTRVFYKLILSYLMVVTWHTESIETKYAISWQYLKKNSSNEVGFLHADKFTIFFNGFAQACTKLGISLYQIYQRKNH